MQENCTPGEQKQNNAASIARICHNTFSHTVVLARTAKLKMRLYCCSHFTDCRDGACDALFDLKVVFAKCRLVAVANLISHFNATVCGRYLGSILGYFRIVENTLLIRHILQFLQFWLI